MNFRLIPFLLAFVIMFSACSSGSDEEETTNEENTEETSEETEASHNMDPELVKLMAGNWEAAYLHVTIADDDTSIVMHVEAPDFPDKLGIQNNYTTYYDDGTYLSSYVSTNGVVMMEEGGTWEITADSLFITQDDSDVLYRYTYEFRGDTATWETLVDWDGDGAMDDHMIGASVPSDWVRQ
jgi:hypothetical protein